MRLIEKEITNPEGDSPDYGRAKAGIAALFQAATEAKDREIERLQSELQRYQSSPEYDCGYANASEAAKTKITQLESQIEAKDRRARP